MEAFPSMSFDGALDSVDWRNLTLLIYDKLKYVGSEKEEKKEKPPIRVTDPDEATKLLKSLKF
jgi:hypothetical protein